MARAGPLGQVITVDCRDVESIKHELLVYVSDNVGAIPAIKLHEFVLSPIGDESIDKSEVVTTIREFLDSIGEARNFAILPGADTISIKSVSGRPIERQAPPAPPAEMFSCPHCGFVTQYEVEYNAHRRIHYL